MADRLAHLHVRIAALADAVHRRRVAVAFVLAPATTALLIAINRLVLLDFPNSADEYNYLYEAQTLAAGRLWNPPLPAPELFATNYVVEEPTRVFSSFPFGWPLALALAMRLALPPWLVNPLLGTATLGLLWWLGARLYSPRVGVVAALVVGVSPFFLFNAASYFSHPLCGALLLGAAAVSSRTDRRPPWVPATVGFLIGWAVVARYLTGVIGGIPVVLWLLRPGVPRVRTFSWTGLGGLPWLVALAVYNSIMTGSMWRLTTTPLTVSLWFRDGFLLRGGDILSTHLLRHLLWTPPAVMIAYLVYLRTATREIRRPPLEWTLILTVAVLYFYVERGGNQYGPRFHYEAFLFVVLFVVANVFRAEPLADRRPYERWLFGLLLASVLIQPISLAVHSRIEHAVIVERMDPFTQAAQKGLRDAVVLIGGRIGSLRSMAATDLTRNGIDYDRTVLFGLDLGDDRHCERMRRLPGRQPYLYVWDHLNDVGLLTPLLCEPATAPPTSSVGFQ